MRGRFLGVAETCGDAFTYVVLPVDEYECPATRHVTLLRSCVRARECDEDAPIVLRKGLTLELELYDKDGEILKEAYSLTPTRKNQTMYAEEFSQETTGVEPSPVDVDSNGGPPGEPLDAGETSAINLNNNSLKDDDMEDENLQHRQVEADTELP